jgi:hypothetical protein
MATDGSSRGDWSNPSVLAFAHGRNPLDAAVAAGRELLEQAIQHGLAAPPVDPFLLAKLLGLQLHPSNDVRDAEIYAITKDGQTSPRPEPRHDTPLAGTVASPLRLAIAYNPSRPRGRLRFSLAHEIAHALFPDVHEAVRRRTPTGAVPPEQRDVVSLHVSAGVGDGEDDDSWELELLCNVIASELLVPIEAVEGLVGSNVDIDYFMEARRRWDVSTETLLRRIVGASPRVLALVAASRRRRQPDALTIDYVLTSDASGAEFERIRRGESISRLSPLGQCTAVGQAARGQMDLYGEIFDVQAVGIPGYPGSLYPRVLALLGPQTDSSASPPTVDHRVGDLFDFPPGDEPLVIAHVVNDSARAWGRRGFAASLARRFPLAASSFRAWAVSSEEHLRLGNAHISEQRLGERTVFVASLVAQQGYGPGAINRLSNEALRSALEVVAETASASGATVLVPRLGAGQAGGRWDLVERDLTGELVARGIRVVVHTLPANPTGG